MKSYTADDPPKLRRWLALGDSYTIGEGVAESERWPAQIAGLLRAEGYLIELSIIARTGWTCEELWGGIQASSLDVPYDLVSLLIGVNNQYRGGQPEEYRRQFRFLLEKAIGYAANEPKRVMVLSIPDWGVTPFASGLDRANIGKAIDVFNGVNREETTNSGVYYVDICPESRRDALKAGFLAPDGLHPSGKMYAEWARLALPSVLAALQNRLPPGYQESHSKH